MNRLRNAAAEVAAFVAAGCLALPVCLFVGDLLGRWVAS